MIDFKRLTKAILVGFALLLAQGCTTMTPQQSTEYAMMEKDGVLVQEKSPSTGAWLGLLPGGGAFYGRSPGVGVVDLLLWPISILWDPVVGYERSKMVNYDVTVAHLKREKEKELQTLEDEHRLDQIDNEEYVSKKKAIDRKYEY